MLRRLCLGLTGATLLLACGTLAAKQPPREVRDLQYGQALFQFYQQNYYSAAVDLLTAQQQQRLQHHDTESQLLLGGIYLSYGLHDEAEAIFQELIDAGTAPSVRDRAWFYLAKIRYHKQLYDAADRALQRIGDALDPALGEELQTLKANLLMARGNYTDAAQALAPLEKRQDTADYARFNLGVALIRTGRELDGHALLDSVGQLQSTDPYLKALRDRANLALGFSLIKADPIKAKDYLARVRLQGPFSSKALLGLGWAAMELQQYAQALVPWDELIKRERVDLAGFEALLGRGYALELLQAYPAAMQSYANAISVYEQEIAALDASRTAIDVGRLWTDLLSQVEGNEMGWFWEAELLPTTPEARFLPVLMSSHGFHEAIKNLRDLDFLARKLASWQDTMPAYGNMLALRRETYEKQLDTLSPESVLARVEDARSRRDVLAQELEQIDSSQDIMALANEKEQKLLKRLKRMEDKMWLMENHERYPEFVERTRFFKGLLEYDLRTRYPIRRWEVQKILRDLDKELEQTLALQDSLQQARAEAPARFEGFDQRIQGMDSRVQALQQEVQDAFQQQGQILQTLVDEELNRLRARMVDYLDQARFSLAHLQDLAASQGGAE